MLNIPDGAIYESNAPFNQKKISDSYKTLDITCDCGSKMEYRTFMLEPYYKCPVCDTEYELKESDFE